MIRVRRSFRETLARTVKGTLRVISYTATPEKKSISKIEKNKIPARDIEHLARDYRG